MRHVEIISGGVMEQRKCIEQERRNRVLSFLKEIPELVEPFRRTSLEDVVYHAARETGMAKAIIKYTLQEITEAGEPLDDSGTTIQAGMRRGRAYLTAIRPEEPVRPLPCPEQDDYLAAVELIRPDSEAVSSRV